MIFFLMLIIASAQGENMAQIDRIKTVYNDLRADNLHILDGFYDPNVKFVDPLGTHLGLTSVKSYYQNLYQNVEQIEFEFTGSTSQENKHVLEWRMKIND